MKREPGLWAVIFLPLVFFFREFLGICRFSGVDHTKLNMPLKFFDVLAVRGGELPLWNPYLFTGAPHLAEGESGFFYLLNWINHLPGDFFYWYGLNIILHFIIAGVTCYALLRYKGARSFAAAIFAILFQFTPFMVYHLTAVALFQVLAWIPLLILLFEMVLDNRRPFWNGFWAVALTAQLICAGSQQMLFLGFMTISFLGVVRVIISRDLHIALRGVCFLIAVSVGGFLLTALQLLPAFEFNALSNRSVPMPPEFYTHGSWLNMQRLASLILFPASNFDPPEDAVGFASSQVFIGLLPLFLVIYAAFDKEIRAKASPYLWVSIPLLILAFGWNIGLYHHLTEFPPFMYFRYLGRTSVLFILFLSIPASLALSNIVDRHFQQGDGLRKSVVGIFIASVVLLAPFFGMGEKAASIAFPLLIVNATLLVAFVWLARSRGRWAAYVAGAFVIMQLITLYPFTRIMSQYKTDFEKSFATVEAIESDENIDLKRLMVGTDVWVVDPDALSSLGFGCKRWLIDQMGGCASTLRRVGCINVYLPLHEMKWKGIIYDRLFLNLRNSPEFVHPHTVNACWLLGINYILVNTPKLDIPGYEQMDASAPYSFHMGAYLYRKEDPYPRFFLTRNIRRFRYYDEQRFVQLLDEETPKDEYGVVIPDSENPPLFNDRLESVGGNIRLIRDGFNSYELEVESDKDCYLIVRDNNIPGWKAKLDGGSTILYSADYINRAVYVPRGVHRIEFIYQPESFRRGLIISAISILLFVIIGVVVKLVLRD